MVRQEETTNHAWRHKPTITITQEAQAEIWKIQGSPGKQSEFMASLGSLKAPASKVIKRAGVVVHLYTACLSCKRVKDH